MYKTIWYISIVATLCIIIAAVYIFPKLNKAEIHFVNSDIFAQSILIENTDTIYVSAYLIFPSGEALNPFEEGLAHYVEHLAWLATFQENDDKQKRHSNAWTTKYSTGYWAESSPAQLRKLLRQLLALADPIDLDTDFALEERDIVLREYDYRYAESPFYKIYIEMGERLYGDGALARSTIGEKAVIAQYSLERAKELHAQSHVLNEATLLVYGNISPKKLKPILDELKPSEQSKPIVKLPKPDLIASGTIDDNADYVSADVQDDTFMYRKAMPLPECGGAMKCALIAELVRRAMDSALPDGLAGPLRFEQFIARSFLFDLSLITNEYAEIYFIASPDHDISLQQLQNTFEKEVNRIFTQGISQKTFETVKERLTGKFNSILDRDRAKYNRDLVLGNLQYGQSVFTLSDQQAALKKIELEDVNLFLNGLQGEGRSVLRRVYTKEGN